MTTAPPPARQRFNPRRRAAALPSSYTTTRDTTGTQVPKVAIYRAECDFVASFPLP